MMVQIHETKQAIRIQSEAADGDYLDMQSAIKLARDLIDAVTQCGYEVKMNVEVPRHQPTQMQLVAAVARVSHIRRANQDRPWNDQHTNTDIVMRVLEACL